ncbi:hypothetical protein [uncultured Bacteroides sp.]|uniref:hypothetical protein n=1 Tax=uncultured Bacteroides sp. TaxID=162156 RepID=UPI002AAAB5F5|nr:hypothetical protein [uncultured Bacteroides sp.]
MASRRNLKKHVNYIAGELFSECMINSLYVPGTNKEKADELMSKVLEMQQEFISRISHTQPGQVKQYYKKLHEDLCASIKAIADGIAALN